MRAGGTIAEAEKTAKAKLVDSVAPTLFPHVAMIIATCLILPVVIRTANRGISTIDDNSVDPARVYSAQVRCQYC
jgi:hypothetical protein